MARRMDLNAQGRKNTPPNLGDEDTVFANDGAVAEDFAGWTADGNEVYQTSQTTMNLSTTDRIQKFKKDFVNDFRGRTAKFTRNGHTYYAHFSDKSSELGKLTHEGNAQSSRSSPSGYKAKIRMLADGNLFELVEDADYEDTAKENGNKNRSHKNAKYWDYYVKTIVVDGKAYDVLISVRLDAPQQGWDGKERYVYSVRFRDNKTAATSIASPAMSKVRRQNDVATDYSIDDNNPEVKQYSISEEAVEEAPDPVERLPGGADIAAFMPGRIKNDLRKAKSKLKNQIAKVMQTSYFADRSLLKATVDDLAQVYFQTGTISEKDANRAFEKLYAETGMVNYEVAKKNKPVMEYLNSAEIRVSEKMVDELSDDVKEALNLSVMEGANLDSVWSRLSVMAVVISNRVTRPVLAMRHTWKLFWIMDLRCAISVSSCSVCVGSKARLHPLQPLRETGTAESAR